MFLHLLKKDTKSDGAESGFVLVTTLSILLTISLLGSWALKTSIFELKVAGSLLRFEKQFNLSEGAANTEGAMLGFFLRPYYVISDPGNFGRLLTPTTDAEFDPGNDTATTLAGITPVDPTSWPWQNLLNDNAATADEYDYRYLVTYLDYGAPPLGYSAASFASYTFRVQGAAPLVIEVGGIKIGPKAST